MRFSVHIEPWSLATIVPEQNRLQKMPMVFARKLIEEKNMLNEAQHRFIRKNEIL